MKELKFRAWHTRQNRMYFRGYQKFSHVLLCEKDPADADGRGKPVKRASYSDVFLLESAGLEDRNHREVFEGDIVRIRHKDKNFVGLVGSMPDMFGSRKLHPLSGLLKKYGVEGNPDNLDIEVLGNEFEDQDLLEKCKQ